FSAMQPGIAVINQRINIAVGDHVDACAAPAVATIRAAARNILFAAKTGSAIAALAGNDFNDGFVYKFHGVRKMKHAPGQGGCEECVCILKQKALPFRAGLLCSAASGVIRQEQPKLYAC